MRFGIVRSVDEVWIFSASLVFLNFFTTKINYARSMEAMLAHDNDTV